MSGRSPMLRLLPALLVCAISGQQVGAAAIQQLSPPLADGAAIQQIEIRSETLPSRYRVVVARIPPTRGREDRLYVGSYILRGSMQEKNLGWAHLMEHVAANNKSSIAGPPRPEGAKFIESNALTRPYYTSFVTVVPRALLPSTIHSRMARAGRFENDPQIFATEVGRVVAELERDTQGQFPAYKSLMELALRRSPRLADEIASVRTANAQTLATAMTPDYRPDRAVIVVAGDIDPSLALSLIRESDIRLRLSTARRGRPIAAARPVLRTGASAIVLNQNRTGHYVIGISWIKPQLFHPDQLPLLIADQLLLGRGGNVSDPTRSDSSPLAIELAKRLGGSHFWDGRAGTWGAPDLVDTGPGLQAVIFNSDRDFKPVEVKAAVARSLQHIRGSAMSDTEINRGKEELARFYESWLLEPNYRVLSDHLMAYVAAGKDPEAIKQIADRIRSVAPQKVRDTFTRYLLRERPLIVILPPGKI